MGNKATRPALFKGLHFEAESIVVCVRWYLRYALSYRDLVSPKRDAAAAKRFFRKAWRAAGHPRPRVINVDGNPSYRKVIGELKQSGELGRRCRYRPAPYFNNIVEQDHRSIKRRVRASQGFRPLTEIGAALERSAQSHDDAAVSIELDQLKTYPSRVEAKFTSSMA